MPYAFLNPDGTIKQVIAKPSLLMRLGDNESGKNPSMIPAGVSPLSVAALICT